jgi:hypothetical protein
MEATDDFLLEIEKQEREIRAYLDSHAVINNGEEIIG